MSEYCVNCARLAQAAAEIGAQVKDLKIQRDELLAACESYLKAHKKGPPYPVGLVGSFQSAVDKAMERKHD